MSISPSKQLVRLFQEAQANANIDFLTSKAIPIIQNHFEESKQILHKVVAYFHSQQYYAVDSNQISFLSKLYTSIISQLHKRSTKDSLNKLSLINSLLELHMHAFNVNMTQRLPSVLLVKAIAAIYPKYLMESTLIADLSLFASVVLTTSQNSKVIMNGLLLCQTLIAIEDNPYHNLLINRIKLCLVDKSDLIRQVAVSVLPITEANLQFLLLRIRDVSTGVRKSVFQTLKINNYFTKLSTQHKLIIAKNGLSDVNETVRTEAINFFNEVIYYFIKNNETHENMKSSIKCYPTEFISLFNSKQLLLNSNDAPTIKCIISKLDVLYGKMELYNYIINIIIKRLKDFTKLSNNARNSLESYIDEDILILCLTIENWTCNNEIDWLTKLEDMMIDREEYQSLFRYYEQKEDYIMLDAIIPLIHHIDIGSNYHIKALLQMYEEFILGHKEQLISTTIDVKTIISKCMGSHIPRCRNDLIGLIVKAICKLYESDKEELLNWLLERVADIIEPIEEISEISSSNGTLFQQVDELFIAANKERELIISIQLKSQKDIASFDMHPIKYEAENNYSKYLSNITALKAQIGNILTKALILLSEFIYAIQYYDIDIDFSKIKNCTQNLISLSSLSLTKNEDGNYFLNKADFDTVDIYQTTLLCFAMEPNKLAEHCKLIRNDIPSCICNFTPFSIATILSLMDNIMRHAYYEFDEQTKAYISQIKYEICRMIYSSNEDIQLLGAMNIGKLLLYDTRLPSNDLICRILQQMSEIDVEKKHRIYNILEIVIKEFCSKSIDNYKCILNTVFTYILICFSAQKCNNSKCLLYKFSSHGSNLFQFIKKILQKLSLCIINVSQHKEMASPLYKLLFMLCLASKHFPYHQELINLIKLLVSKKIVTIQSAVNIKYKLMKLIDNLPILKNDSIIEKFTSSVASECKKKLKTSYSDEKLNLYAHKKNQIIALAINSLNELGNRYLSEDVSHINRPESLQSLRFDQTTDIKFDILLNTANPNAQRSPTKNDISTNMKIFKV